MSRLIDADALLSKGQFVVRMNEFGEYFVTVEEINKMTTVDAVQVVRCRDCKHTKDDGCGAIYCKIWDKWEMPEDFFCADGERRTDEQQS